MLYNKQAPEKSGAYAGVAHLVERHLAKVEVASSSLVARSTAAADLSIRGGFFCIRPSAGARSEKD